VIAEEKKKGDERKREKWLFIQNVVTVNMVKLGPES